jgi:hypothetical protein
MELVFAEFALLSFEFGKDAASLGGGQELDRESLCRDL